MGSLHCSEEAESLELLKEIQSILFIAVQSLINKTPTTPESNHLGYAAKSVHIATDGYIFLRESGRVHASKMLIRPMLDVVLTATAVTKKKGFLFRKYFTEMNDAKKIIANDAATKESFEKELEELKRQFQQDEPSYPIECKTVTAYDTAMFAGLGNVYQFAYRTYCEYTHSGMRAMQGDLDQATDLVDTSIVIWCVFSTLQHLQNHTQAIVPNLTSFEKRIRPMI